MIKKYGKKEVEYIDKHYNDKLPMSFNSRAWLELQIKIYESKTRL
jgi:hypothetical protein